jgi:hypothetical protein
MAGKDRETVGGLYPDESSAEAAAAELEGREQVPTRVAEGGVATEQSVASSVFRYALAGAIVGLVVGLVVGAGFFVARQPDAVVAFLMIPPTIVFTGAFIGVVVAVARRGGAAAGRQTLVVADQVPADKRAGVEATISSTGGDVAKPATERGVPPRRKPEVH